MDDDSKCPGECHDCNDGDCEDDDSKCTGECHDGCSGGNCVSDDSLCPGDCEDCNDGNCEDHDEWCTGECDECYDGNCVDVNSLCTGCESCQGGNCVDDSENCSGECHECVDGDCVDSNNLCTGECHDGCSGGECVDDDSKCTGECHDCNDGNCEDDDSLCPGECEGCSGGDCVDHESLCSGCKSCVSGSCVDNDSKCSGCKSCVGGVCTDDNSNCPTNYSCTNGVCICTGSPSYSQDTVITTPSITAPSDNSIFLPSTAVTLTCSTSTDSDTYSRCVSNTWTVGPVSDNTISYTWSAKWVSSGLSAGSFPSGNTGQSVTWNAPSSTGDVTIKVVADDDGTKYNDSSVNDTITVGIVSVGLNIWNGKTNGSGNPVADANEESIGAYLLVNWDDDNSNDSPDLDDLSVTGEDDLSKISLSYGGASTGTLELIKTGSNIKIWQNETKGTEQTVLSWNMASGGPPSPLWVEGTSASSSERDVQLEIKYTRSGNSKSDKVKATVVVIRLGNAVYRKGGTGVSDKGHSALVTDYTGPLTHEGFSDANNFEITEAQIIQGVITTTLNTITNDPDLEPYGCYTNSGITYANRLAILRTAEDAEDVVLYCPQNVLMCTFTEDDDYMDWDGTVDDIMRLRCDGVVEACYEINGIDVWAMKRTYDNPPTFNHDISDQADSLSYDPIFGVWLGWSNDAKDNLEEHNDFDAIGDWDDTLLPATQCGKVTPDNADTSFVKLNLCYPIGNKGGN